MTAPRTLLGRHDTLFFRERVYQLDDAIEVDEFTLTTVERRRVPFEDVLATTYHQRRGPVFLAVTGILAVSSGLAAGILIAGENDSAIVGALVLGPIAAGFLLAFLLRAVLGIDVVTVHGRRTSARLAFVYRKTQARETFERLNRLIRERQEKVAGELPPPPPPEDVPLPPGPEPPPPASA